MKLKDIETVYDLYDQILESMNKIKQLSKASKLVLSIHGETALTTLEWESPDPLVTLLAKESSEALSKKIKELENQLKQLGVEC